MAKKKNVIRVTHSKDLKMLNEMTGAFNDEFPQYKNHLFVRDKGDETYTLEVVTTDKRLVGGFSSAVMFFKKGWKAAKE